ncbi:addiction module killer protein [Serratia marcescens]|uniref:Type II toxin-antitoxin system RelE/ParE family toxin n=1 Tax=Serratia marcescens TaxID=615 RepID=A0A5C7C5Z2_SERMA|nr:type II toxin-antitoxin system RelE/ParE family toxin [Serratia marcescens]KKZ15798.1 addiction module killer protein [Serratia marcescens]TXE28295.1 type II toxin-antitoxin system RelE/ParE family toxin [Serratia marcescens]TXE56898.1 type II toxin-antitoxin system RelE/ParE family toxin [Serratia marcescens]
MYKSQFYQDQSGKQPFKEWLDKLQQKDRIAAAKIDTRIDRAETGNFGDHKFEREGVWELRIDYGPGYRVYYSMEDGQIILLLIGGSKKTQAADLDKAVNYLKDFKARAKQNDSNS